MFSSPTSAAVLLAAFLGEAVNARGFIARDSVSTAPGGTPATTGVTAGTTATGSNTAIPTVASSGSVQATTTSVQPTPTNIGQFIDLTEYNGTDNPVELSISVNGGGRNQTAPWLYGWMFEDINHSGDGGIYAELLTNRAFQGSTVTLGTLPGISGSSVVGAENPILPFGPVITGWAGIGGVDLSLTLLHPLSPALPIAMEMDIPWNATGEVGILNYGWWGMDVSPQTYNVSFYILANGPRDDNNNTLSHIDVSLRSNLTGEVWTTTSIATGNISDFSWTQYTAQIVNNVTAPNSNNTFAITFDAAEVAGNTYYFSLLSLFPETYNDRPNGLRKDLAGAIKDMGAKFLRFPGGNNIEGYSIEQRWKWNETIGPLIDRKGRVGDWEYINTNGLGLLEFLEWCEDLDMEPLLAVYAGFSLDIWGQEGTSFPEDRMGDVLDDILNELEYIMGDTSTPYGALRASHGHAAPFDIKMIEIGNEDWFSSTYPYRFPILYQGIKAAYPNITLISTAYNENANYNISIPAGGMWDTHHYEEPSFFMGEFDYFDNWQEETDNEGVTVFIGEYAAFQLDTPGDIVNFTLSNPAHIAKPDLIGAIAEAVYLIGAERNPNVVKLSSYAPSFQNLNWYNWDPDLVQFTADPRQTVLSVSYYNQKLLNMFHGTETLPVTTVSGDFNPLWWVASIDGDDKVYFKVVNSGNSSIPLTLNFDTAFTSVNGTVLTNEDLLAFNYVNNATAVVPVPIEGLPQGSNSTAPYGNSTVSWTWEVPKWSINVLQFDL